MGLRKICISSQSGNLKNQRHFYSIKNPETMWNRKVWMWSWYLFIAYFHNVLIVENSTYSYAEYNFSWSTPEFWGLENTACFFQSLWCLEVGRIPPSKCLPGGIGNDFPPIRLEGQKDCGFGTSMLERSNSGVMDDQKDSGILYSRVHFLSQMTVPAAAMNTGRVLGSQPEDKSHHWQWHARGND